MNGHCGHCREYVETFHFRIAGLGLRFLCSDCIAWMHAVGMDIYPVTDADPRKPVQGRRPVWSATVRGILTGRAVA